MAGYPSEQDMIDMIRDLQARMKSVEGRREGHNIQDEDDGALPQRARIGFEGAGVTATDDPANDRTAVTVPGAVSDTDFYQTVQDEGADQTQRGKLDFEGTGVTVTDDSGGGRTVVTIPGAGGGGSTAGPYNITHGANSTNGLDGAHPSGVILDAIVALTGGFNLDSGFVTDPGGPGNWSYSEVLGTLPTQLRPTTALYVFGGFFKNPFHAPPEPCYIYIAGDPDVGLAPNGTLKLVTHRSPSADASDSYVQLGGIAYYKS